MCSNEMDLAQSVQQLEYANEKLHERNQKLQLQVYVIYVCSYCLVVWFVLFVWYGLFYGCVSIQATHLSISYVFCRWSLLRNAWQILAQKMKT